MSKENLPFKDWLAWVFDHPVADPAWHWDIEKEWHEPTPGVTIDYLTALFERPNEHLPAFSDAQVAQGITLLYSPSCSDHFFCYFKEDIPLEKRPRGVRAFIPLFTDYFAARCTSRLGHLNEPAANPLNSVCYMWWDACPFYGGRDEAGHEQIDAASFEVMKACLATKSDACRESALHGVGHYAIYDQHKALCQQIVDEFLSSAKDLRPELIAYAKLARAGRVL